MAAQRDRQLPEGEEEQLTRREDKKAKYNTWTMKDLRQDGEEHHIRLLRELAARMQGQSVYHVTDLEALNFDAFAYTALLMAHGTFSRALPECTILRSSSSTNVKDHNSNENTMTAQEIIRSTIALFQEFSSHTLTSVRAIKINAEDRFAIQSTAMLNGNVSQEKLIDIISAFRRAYNKHTLSTVGAMQLHSKDYGVKIVYNDMNGFLIENHYK